MYRKQLSTHETKCSDLGCHYHLESQNLWVMNWSVYLECKSAFDGCVCFSYIYTYICIYIYTYSSWYHCLLCAYALNEEQTQKPCVELFYVLAEFIQPACGTWAEALCGAHDLFAYCFRTVLPSDRSRSPLWSFWSISWMIPNICDKGISKSPLWSTWYISIEIPYTSEENISWGPRTKYMFY